MEIVGSRIQVPGKLAREVSTADDKANSPSFASIVKQNHKNHKALQLSPVEESKIRKNVQTADAVMSPHSAHASTNENTQQTITFATAKDQEVSFLSSKITQQ